MKRREFILALGGAAAGWPLAARAQQSDKPRLIGVLMNIEANDPQASAEMAAFAGGLQKRGWILGSNLRIEYRWGAGQQEPLSQICRRIGSAFSGCDPGRRTARQPAHCNRLAARCRSYL